MICIPNIDHTFLTDTISNLMFSQAERVYGIDVEIWPTNVVAVKGGKLILEVSSGDTQGCGIFQNTSEIDR